MSQPRVAAAGQGVADAAHADDAERAAGEVLAEVAQRLPGFPLAGAGVWCPSTTRRAAAISRQKAMSAVASVSTPGVLPTAMPRAVAAGTSMLLKPTA